jgi:hypothetical protein
MMKISKIMSLEYLEKLIDWPRVYENLIIIFISYIICIITFIFY